ncbi:MAG: sulfurtransferase [Thermodesulfovibrionia bacterium]
MKGRGFKRMRWIFIGGFLLFFTLSVFVVQYALGSGSPLVETDWLEQNLKAPDIKIVYVGSPAQDDMAKFGNKHIPGSMYMSVGSLMKVLGDGSTPPNKAEFEALMGRLGITNDSHVVLYGEGGENPFVATAFWVMDYFGHKKLGYLNGALGKWAKENRKTESGAPPQTSPTKYTATPNPSILADADYVLKNMKNPSVVLVDTRAEDEFKGQNAMGNKRVGHIPGAINLNYHPTNLNSDGTFKSIKDLKSAYESKGITKDKEAITYCQGGVRASHTYFVLKYLLGYPKVRNYVGSWGEWGNRLDPSKYPAEK